MTLFLQFPDDNIFPYFLIIFILIPTFSFFSYVFLLFHALAIFLFFNYPTLSYFILLFPFFPFFPVFWLSTFLSYFVWHNFRGLNHGWTIDPWSKLPAVPRKGFWSADCDTIYNILLFLCTQTADPKPFQGTHCI